MLYKENNVFEEALERIRYVFDYHDDIIVSMSGGKDSTALFNLCLMVAKEKNRLPLKVFWLDQEAEWQSTVDYMSTIMHRPDVIPLWYQIEFDFTNSLSAEKNFLKVFDHEKRDMWIHDWDEVGIHDNPTKYHRYHDLVKYIPAEISEKKTAVMVGMRMVESPRRRMSCIYSDAKWHGLTWCTTAIGNARKFWPIYDWTDDDVWTAIARNHWEYNKIYDMQYQYGVAKKDMRVSALIHETSWHAIEMLQEFEPKTYDKFVSRLAGVSTFNHSFDEGGIIPRQLPFMFKDWKEYRDYLLEHITKPEYWDLFRKRWKNQVGDDWYRVHVKEVIINDIDGTVNQNHAYGEYSKARLQGKYKNKDREKFGKAVND